MCASCPWYDRVVWHFARVLELLVYGESEIEP